MKDITVYLADDHTLFRKGMRRLLQSFEGIGRIEEAENGKRLIDLVEKKSPDIVLLDVRMPVMDGFDTCVYLMRNFKEVKVIMLSMENGRETILELIRKGAKGYLSKVAEPEELALAIETVLVSDYFINAYLSRELIELAKNEYASKQNSQSNRTILSQRELEILNLTCNGLSMRQIAYKLYLSERTVHNHRSNMMRKLNVSNANGLVTYALTNQIFNQQTSR